MNNNSSYICTHDFIHPCWVKNWLWVVLHSVLASLDPHLNHTNQCHFVVHPGLLSLHLIHLFLTLTQKSQHFIITAYLHLTCIMSMLNDCKTMLSSSYLSSMNIESNKKWLWVVLHSVPVLHINKGLSVCTPWANFQHHVRSPSFRGCHGTNMGAGFVVKDPVMRFPLTLYSHNLLRWRV